MSKLVLLENIIKSKINENRVMQHQSIAIYGTGEAAKLVCEIMVSGNMMSQLIGFVDTDDKVRKINSFLGKPVFKLREACEQANVLIIASFNYYNEIEKRVLNYIDGNRRKNDIVIVNPFRKESTVDYEEYIEFLEDKDLDTSCFVEFEKHDFCLLKEDPKYIAWYLPQYYENEVNNENYGKGFTDWNNVSKVIPMYCGHYQPHRPYDLGYYNLQHVEIIERQVELARNYGITGFGFYYYWFSGKRVLEKPLELFLDKKDIDFPFCVHWANENWSRLWDGGDKDIILEQKWEKGDEVKFARDLMSLFSDYRYIRVDGKPLFVMYRPSSLGKELTKSLFSTIRTVAKENGFPDVYILVTNAFGFEDKVYDWGGDGMIEFPPFGIKKQLDKSWPTGYLNSRFKGSIYDGASMIDNRKYKVNHEEENYYQGIMTSFDNSARKAYSDATIFDGISPAHFKKWLLDISVEGRKLHQKDNNYIFVNAWNEWAEGAHLEPDYKYGYGFLQALYETIKELRRMEEND